nr:immunoglobulin light chain junction region [Macaca mulatta]
DYYCQVYDTSAYYIF